MAERGVETGSGAGDAWLALCPGCGYDLSGTDLDRSACPECGWKATAEWRGRLRAAWEFKHRSAERVFGVLVVSAVVGALEYGLVIGVAFGHARGVLLGIVVGQVPVALGVVIGGLWLLTLGRWQRVAAMNAWTLALPWLLAAWWAAPLLRLVLHDVSPMMFQTLLMAISLGGALGWWVHWSVLVERAAVEVGSFGRRVVWAGVFILCGFTSVIGAIG